MQKKDRIAKIYAQIPKINCLGKCHISCSHILSSHAESKIIEDEIESNQFSHYQNRVKSVVNRGNLFAEVLTCPMLTKEKKCSIYELRPMICRLFGVVKKMTCPHGCLPERWLSDKEAKKLLKWVNKL